MTSTEENDSRGHLPEGQWAFDDNVTKVFDDMLARSIPQYGVMRSLVADIAEAYVQRQSGVVDLGCSRGEALYTVRQRVEKKHGHESGVTYTGVEISAPMHKAAKMRFAEAADVEILHSDLRGFSVGPMLPSVVLCVLTLQFVPINYRARILRDIYLGLKPGGALIVVEKVLGETAELDAALVRMYHALKVSQGYTGEEVARKSAALEGVLVPVTASMNVSFMEHSGFREVDCFWRYLNFAGWVALKE